MIMADILKILLIVVGILTIFVSYWLLAEALFPEWVNRASLHYSKPVKLTWVGLAVALVPVGLGLAMANAVNPMIRLLGLTLLATPILLGLVGSAGLTQRIGSGLSSPLDEQQPWRRVYRGGILLACAFLLPIVGWIVMPLWVLLSGFGAFILCLKEQRDARTQPTSADFLPNNQLPG